MTIFLGLISLNKKTIDTSISENLKNAALKTLKLDAFTHEVSNQNFAIYQYDIGVFAKQFDEDTNGDIAAIAGQPIFNDKGIDTSYDLSIVFKHKSDLSKLLPNARGTFSGVCHDSINNKTFLFTDKVGIRPIFYIVNSDYLYYSSNFSVLKNLFFDDLTLCPDGIKEYLTLGYSLDDKTAFKVPMKQLAYHNAYSKWFNHFPKFTRETPWQTYPDHVPCPLKPENKLYDQWQMNKKTRTVKLKDALDTPF